MQIPLQTDESTSGQHRSMAEPRKIKTQNSTTFNNHELDQIAHTSEHCKTHE